MAFQIDPKAIVQTLDINNEMLKLTTPFAMCITGSSMSGKSEFIVRIIQNRKQLVDTEFEQIFYCEPEALAIQQNPIFDKIKEHFPTAQIVSGLPDVAKLNLSLNKHHKLLIIDDLMESFLQSEAMVRLLSIEVHRFNISTIFTLQNFFAPSRFGKTLARNLHYRCIFFNRLDLTEIRTISCQICNQPKFLLDCFEFLRKEFPNEPPYILVDGHNLSHLKDLFVRSKIFPDEEGKIRPIIFFPK